MSIEHKLTTEQQTAFNDISAWIKNKKPTYSLTGYAGTGKTYLISKLKHQFPPSTTYTSLTGKAALRLTEIGVKASTLHSVLYRQPEILKNGSIVFNKVNDPNCRFLIVDESSMLSPKLYDDLKNWIRLGVKILFVGDDFQLPCIVSAEDKKLGYDENFSIFSSVKGSRLTQIMRNTDNIIKVATHIRNNGDILRDSNENYSFNYSKELINDVVQSYLEDRQDHIVICWTNKLRMKLNVAIRKTLGYTHDIPEKGEPVFICKNSVQGGVLNGEVKIVKDIFPTDKVGEVNVYRLMTDDGKYLLVSCDGGDIMMDGKMAYVKNWKKYLQDLKRVKEDVIPISYGYVSTVHKIQGNQARKITIALYADELRSDIFNKDTMLCNGEIVPFSYRFLYTSATRAEKELNIIVGI